MASREAFLRAWGQDARQAWINPSRTSARCASPAVSDTLFSTAGHFYNGRMTYRVDAIFEGGVFRPTDPLDLPDGQRVSLNVNTKPTGNDDLDDVEDMLDSDFAQTYSANAESAPSLAEIRGILSAFSGSLADRISEERDER